MQGVKRSTRQSGSSIKSDNAKSSRSASPTGKKSAAEDVRSKGTRSTGQSTSELRKAANGKLRDMLNAKVPGSAPLAAPREKNGSAQASRSSKKNIPDAIKSYNPSPTGSLSDYVKDITEMAKTTDKPAGQGD